MRSLLSCHVPCRPHVLNMDGLGSWVQVMKEEPELLKRIEKVLYHGKPRKGGTSKNTTPPVPQAIEDILPSIMQVCCSSVICFLISTTTTLLCAPLPPFPSAPFSPSAPPPRQLCTHRTKRVGMLVDMLLMTKPCSPICAGSSHGRQYSPSHCNGIGNPEARVCCQGGGATSRGTPD